MKLIISLLLMAVCSIASADKIYIGLDADMTALAKEGGIAIERGARIAIDQLNDAGGVLGCELELIVKDHRGNPARGVANIKYFAKKEGIVAVLGGVHTPVALAELPVIHENQLLYLDPWAAGTAIVDNKYKPSFVFRVSVRDEQAGKVLLDHASRSGHKKIALLLERTGWGRSNEASMKAAAKNSNVEITAIEWFNWGQTDFSESITKILQSRAEAIALVANAPEGVQVVKSLINYKESERLPIISHWGISGGNFVNKLGLENLAQVNIAVLQTYNFLNPSDSKRSQWFLDQYNSKFDAEVTAETFPGASGAVHAYDLVNMLAHAIESAGSLDRLEIRNEMEKLPAYDGLVKKFVEPFSKGIQDALLAPDYFMAKYNENGYLVPLEY